ncbi:protein spire homolog 1-like isoform X4 [Mytilus galloprovincialis]|uniref:protein spire homolog 1-like isoform X4 n=1 Tax=Mytilus galloprovincialis TaxID=29158 RepID=UPI003F7BB898
MANTSQNENGEIFIDSLSLEDILVAFNNAVNEEQAWSVCYQCAQFFQNFESQSLDDCRFKYHELYKYGKRALKFNKDGAVFIEYSEISRGTGKGPPGKLKRKNSVTGKDIKIVTENDAIQALGLVIYQALDFGLGDNEERHLGRDLEHLLELMINPDEEDETFNADDEGIEKDAKEGCTFQEITVLCVRHLTSNQDAGYHYKAVCRALAAEAAELLLFLDKVTRENKRLVETQLLDKDLQQLDNLQRADWARLWVQMMRELRQGVRLKKVEHIHLPPVEFELTPFEILLEDIRTRRYTLNKVQVNGDIPNTVKSDAHDVMLDFIRSRPPLQPAKDRVLKSPPKRELSVREQLLLHIRSQPPKLKSVSEGQHMVETSRTKLDNNNEKENPQPVRKVIKPDFNLLLDSFEDDEDDDSSTLSPKSRRSSVATPSPEQEVPQWRRTVVRDVVTQERHNILKRRNTITVCESPQKWQHPIECLSLTLEEVMHIRTVLTKAELESLINQPEFYTMISKGKVCFTCKEVKFSLLGQWGNRCKICKRNVCNNCLRKMNIPTEHFHNIPVHTLSPIPLGQEALDILKVYESTGSVPHSPLTQKKLLREIENKSPKKSLQRSQTFNSSPNLASPLPNKNLLKGPQMNVCCECKKMIMDIIRTSRTSIALINKRKTVQSTTTSNEEKRPSSLSASSLSLSVKNFFTQK